MTGLNPSRRAVTKSGTGRNPESGFALLFVFLMAAAIAISLYMEMPRVAFEAQRNREELLIERGEQYRRGIQLYFRKLKRYPPNLEALENTNNVRFLRKRYKDPMTGSEEWRLIHAGPGGVLIDSLVHAPPGKEEKGSESANTYIAELPAVGSAVNPSGVAVSAVPARRPSEGGAPQPGAESGTVQQGLQPESGVEGAQPEGGQSVQQQQGFNPAYPALGQPGNQQAQQYPYGQQPGGQQLQPGVYPQQPVPGQIFPFPQPTQGQGSPATMSPNPSNQQPGQPQYRPPVPVPGLPAPFSRPLSQNPGSQPPVPTATGTFIAPPFQQPGATPPSRPASSPQQGQSPVAVAPGQNPAVELIRRLLTTPNPRGAAAIRQQTGQQVGGGLAGVASKLEAEGIKIYNDRTKYNEWEFIYDFSQDRMNAGLAGAPGAQAAPGQQPALGQQPAPGPQPGAFQQPAGPGNLPQAPGPGLPPGRRQ